jgi:hypothetical protein
MLLPDESTHVPAPSPSEARTAVISKPHRRYRNDAVESLASWTRSGYVLPGS